MRVQRGGKVFVDWIMAGGEQVWEMIGAAKQEDGGATMQGNREAAIQKDREAAGGRNGMEREYSRGLCDGDVRRGGGVRWMGIIRVGLYGELLQEYRGSNPGNR